MTLLLILAIFGLMLTTCVHFLLLESKRLKNRETNAPAYWRPSHETRRATSANRQA